MTTQTALIVDDEPDIRDLLEITLTRMGITALTAPVESITDASSSQVPGTCSSCGTVYVRSQSDA